MYYPSGLLLSCLLNLVCPISHAEMDFSCAAFWICFLLGALACLFFGAIKEFERAGRWLWLKFVPAWAEV